MLGFYKKKSQTIFFIIIFYLVKSNLYGIHPQQTNLKKKLSLKEAIQNCLDLNHDIRLSSISHQIARNSYHFSFLSILPNIKFSIKDKISTYGLYNPDDDIYYYNSPYTSIDLEWNVLQIPYNILNTAITHKQYKRFKMEKNIKIENKIEETAKKYLEYVIAISTYEVIKENFELCQKGLEVNKKYYTLGKIPKCDYLESQIEQNKLQSQMLDQKEQINFSRIELNDIMNKPRDFEYIVDLEIDIDNELKWDTIYKDFISNNNQIKYQKLLLNIAQINITKNNLDLIPTLNIGLNYNIVKFDSEKSWKTKKGNLNLNLKLEFDFHKIIFAINNRINSSLEKKIALFKSKIKNRSLQSTLFLMFQKYTHYLKKIDLEQKNLIITKENVEISKIRHQKGVITTFEYHKALYSQKEAKLTLLKTYKEAKILEIILKKLTGKIYSQYL